MTEMLLFTHNALSRLFLFCCFLVYKLEVRVFSPTSFIYVTFILFYKGFIYLKEDNQTRSFKLDPATGYVLVFMALSFVMTGLFQVK